MSNGPDRPQKPQAISDSFSRGVRGGGPVDAASALGEMPALGVVCRQLDTHCPGTRWRYGGSARTYSTLGPLSAARAVSRGVLAQWRSSGASTRGSLGSADATALGQVSAVGAISWWLGTDAFGSGCGSGAIGGATTSLGALPATGAFPWRCTARGHYSGATPSCIHGNHWSAPLGTLPTVAIVRGRLGTDAPGSSCGNSATDHATPPVG